MRLICLVPEAPLACKSKTFPLANIGKSVEEVTVVPVALLQTAKLLETAITLVCSFSRSKPLGVRVTGSWSKRGVFACTTSMRPWKLTMVAMEFLTNEGIRNMIGAGVMNKILLDMAVVGAMAGGGDVRWADCEKLLWFG